MSAHKVRSLVLDDFLDDLRPYLVGGVPIIVIFLFLLVVLSLVGFQLCIGLDAITAVARLLHILNDVYLLVVHETSELVNGDHRLAAPVIELSV